VQHFSFLTFKIQWYLYVPPALTFNNFAVC
jgi:hypothetical protein